MLLVGGLANTFPVFLPPLLAEFGGTRAAGASAMTLFWVGSAVVGPLAGRLVDRVDPRLVIGGGLVATALGASMAALSPSLAAFSLALGVGGGIGAGLTGFVTQAAVIAETYRERRGFATGIAFSGSMVGYALASPAQWTITAVGWRWTLAGWALALIALVPLVAAHYPRRLGGRAPASPSGGPGVAAGASDPRRDDGPVATPPPGGLAGVVWSVPFWALAVVFTAPPLAGYLMTIQHSLYFPARGYTAGEAATMLLVGGLLSTAGRAAAGFACDRLGGPATGLASWALSLAGALCLIAFELAPAAPLAWAYVFLVFLPMGSRATIVSVLVTRIAPPGRFGAVFGLLAIGNSLGAASGPFLSGVLYDLTRSYLVVFLTAIGVIVTATAALVVFLRTAPAPPR
jgi:MFS family permease